MFDGRTAIGTGTYHSMPDERAHCNDHNRASGRAGATMNRTVPWSIKGVGSDTREAAKEAARRSGLSLGEWLDGIIAERASKLGVPTVEVDNRERLEAVAVELSRLAGRSSNSENPSAGDGPVSSPRAASGNKGAGHAEARFAGFSGEEFRSRGMSPQDSPSFGPTALSVERAPGGNRNFSSNVVQAVQGRGSVDNRIRGAVHGSLAETLDVDDHDLLPTQKAFQALSEKLAGFEQQNWSRAIGAAPEDPTGSTADLPNSRGRKATSAIRSAKERSIRDAVAEITRRQAALDVENPAAAGHNGEAVEFAAADPGPAASSPAAAPLKGPDRLRSEAIRGGASLGDLNAAVSALEARLKSGRAVVERPDENGTPTATGGNIGLHQDLSSAGANTEGQPLTSSEATASAGRRRDVNSPDVAEPDDGKPACDADPMSAFETLGRDLRQAIDSDGMPSRTPRRSQQARDVAGNVESASAGFPAKGIPGRPRREVRDGSATKPARSLVDGVERQVASIEATPEPLQGGQRGDVLEAVSTLSEIRALLDGFEPGSTISSLEQRMEDLAAKIDLGMGPQSSSKQIEDLARRIDEVHSSIQSQAGASLTEPRSVEALVRGIADRIEEAREASADIQRLESLIRGLAAKIDDGKTQPDHRAVEALEVQMSRLGDRLERSEASLSALDGVEHSLGELFAQLEETRHATIDAAENAARTAARDTLRAAMQIAPVPAGESGIVEQVTQELSELRVIHDASSRRTQATLAALHQTMEKLVEHLARFDVDGRSGSGVPWQPADASVTPPSVEPSEKGRAGGAPSVRAEPGLQELARLGKADRRPADSVDPMDTLIEPGSGRAPVRERTAKPESGVWTAAAASSAGVALPSGELEGPASFIAAARRAAYAAQASAAAVQKPANRVRVPGDAKSTRALSSLERARNFLVARRRPILLSLAGLVLLLGALEVAKLGFSGSAVPERIGAAEAVETGSVEAAGQSTGSDPLAAKSAVASLDVGQAGAKGSEASLNPPPKTSPEAASTPAEPGVTAETGPSGTKTVGTIKNGVAARNMNPFLPGSDFQLGGLGEGLRTMALAGDPAAQYEVGLRFSEGRTVGRDVKVAATWFEKAAAQGLVPAQYRLGSAYEKGIGQPRDLALAMAWYGRAAEAGNMRAMHNLAVMAAEGSVGKPDYAKAATWFAKAAALGVRDSQFNLAILYARGLGIEQSLAQSYTWFAIAAGQGDDDAAKKRDEVGARLDAKTLASAKAAAESFRPGTAVSAANEVAPPPGGWEASAPSRSAPSATKGAPPKVSVM